MAVEPIQMKSFSQAVDYVNNNQETWDRMINACYDAWAFDLVDSRPFNEYVLSEFGIKMNHLSYNNRSYQVVNRKKYMMFQIKFS